MSDYIRTINNIPVSVDSSQADIPGAYVGTYALGSGEMTAGQHINSNGSLVTYASGYYSVMPLVEDVHVISNGHTVSYSVVDEGNHVLVNGYNCGDAVVSRDLGPFVRVSADIGASTLDERDRTRPHFVMEKGGREQLVRAFDNASDTLTWQVGTIGTNGANSSSNYYIRSSEVLLADLVGIVTLDGTPITINARTDSANLYTNKFDVVRAITKADILKVWPTATRIKIVYGDGTTTQDVANASNVYVGVRS